MQHSPIRANAISQLGHLAEVRLHQCCDRILATSQQNVCVVRAILSAYSKLAGDV